MRIAVIGGLSRNEAEIMRRARQAGHQLECHTGDANGRGSAEIEAMIERCDLVVVVTQLVSHNGVHVAKRAARRVGCPSLLLRTCGPARFERLLQALERRAVHEELTQLVGG